MVHLWWAISNCLTFGGGLWSEWSWKRRANSATDEPKEVGSISSKFSAKLSYGTLNQFRGIS
jgi:hypothetical protein